MRSHHKVCIDEDPPVTDELSWVDRGPVAELWRPMQLMLSFCQLAPCLGRTQARSGRYGRKAIAG